MNRLLLRWTDSTVVQLLAAWAMMVADGKDNPEEPVMAEIVPAVYDPVVELQKLQWKREKFDKQMRLE